MMRISPHFSLPVYIGEWPITAYTMQIYCALSADKNRRKRIIQKIHVYVPFSYYPSEYDIDSTTARRLRAGN